MNFEIFWVFFKIGLMSFGGVFGVLPELERMIVAERHWITHDQFIQSYVMAQFLPGPNMVMCPIIGYWVNGIGGLIAGFLGIYSGPMFIMGGAYWVYSKYQEVSWVRRSEVSLRPLVFALLGSAMVRLWWLQSSNGIAGFEAYSRVVAFLLCALVIWLYVKKWLGPVTGVFTVAGIWWLTSWLMYLQK